MIAFDEVKKVYVLRSLLTSSLWKKGAILYSWTNRKKNGDSYVQAPSIAT